jgi:hypothetical protein
VIALRRELRAARRTPQGAAPAAKPARKRVKK